MRPNNSFKPNLLCYTDNMAGKACHVVGNATQVGLTQALGIMKTLFQKIALAATFIIFTSASATQAEVHFIKFPNRDVERLGQIDKLTVSVACSRISQLTNIPELHGIRMGYEMPTRNDFEAKPRLGAAAVDLRRWNNVIGVLIPADADSASCFSVTVTAEGRGTGVSEVTQKWTGHELGF